MQPRLADDRVGYFTVSRFDFADDTKLTPKRQLRHALAPGEEGSCRGAVGAEAADRLLDRPQRAGEVPRRRSSRRCSNGTRRSRRSATRTPSKRRSSPTTPTSDTLDARHASIRWMTTARPSFGGIGPSQTDPRTGRDPRRRHRHRPGSTAQPRASSASSRFPTRRRAARAVAHAEHAEYLCQDRRLTRRRRRGFAMDLLEARGDIEPDGPRRSEFVLDDLKEIVMHEVGHTLGLRHNFRASTVYTQAQLDDRGVHAAERHLRLGDGVQRREHRARRPSSRASTRCRRSGPTTTGRSSTRTRRSRPSRRTPSSRASPRAAASPRSRTPPTRTRSIAIDPEANQADLGGDPLEFARRRFALVAGDVGALADQAAQAGRELCRLPARRRARPARDVAARRPTPRSTSAASRRCAITRAARAHPLTPVDVEQAARRAEDHRRRRVLAPTASASSPSSCAACRSTTSTATTPTTAACRAPGIDYSLNTQVLDDAAQGAERADERRRRAAAARQRSEGRATPGTRCSSSELYGTLSDAIWSELKSGARHHR